MNNSSQIRSAPPPIPQRGKKEQTAPDLPSRNIADSNSYQKAKSVPALPSRKLGDSNSMEKSKSAESQAPPLPNSVSPRTHGRRILENSDSMQKSRSEKSAKPDLPNRPPRKALPKTLPKNFPGPPAIPKRRASQNRLPKQTALNRIDTRQQLLNEDTSFSELGFADIDSFGAQNVTLGVDALGEVTSDTAFDQEGFELFANLDDGSGADLIYDGAGIYEPVRSGTQFQREEKAKERIGKRIKLKDVPIADQKLADLYKFLSLWYDRKVEAEEEIARYEGYIRRIDKEKGNVVVKYLGPETEGSIQTMFLQMKLKELVQAKPFQMEAPLQIDELLALRNFSGESVQLSWFSTIIDLIIVTFVLKLGQQIMWTHLRASTMDSPDEGSAILRGLCEGFIIFFAFFVMWLEGQLIWTRFSKSDDFYELTFSLDLLLMGSFGVSLLFMAVLIDTNDYLFSKPQGFMSGYCLTNLSLLGFYVLYYNVVRTARVYTKKRCMAFLLFSFLSFCAAWDPADQSWIVVLVLMICASATFIIQLNSLRVHSDAIPAYIKHLAYRFGTLVMIILGENVLSLALIDINKHDAETAIAIFTSFLVMFLIYDQYVKSNVPAEYHALSIEDSPGSLCWVFLHIPLCFCILVMGVGYKLLVSNLQDDGATEPYENSAYLLLFFMPMSIAFVWLLRFTHSRERFYLNDSFTRRWRPACLICVPLGLSFLAPTDSPLGESFYLLGFMLFIWVMDYHFLTDTEFIYEFDQENFIRFVGQERLTFSAATYFRKSVAVGTQESINIQDAAE